MEVNYTFGGACKPFNPGGHMGFGWAVGRAGDTEAGSPIPNDSTTGEDIVRSGGTGLSPDGVEQDDGPNATPAAVGKTETNLGRLISKVIQTDCIAGLNSLEKGSVAAIVTSPPYNIGKRYQGSDDNEGDYLSWMRSVFVSCKQALADNGHFFLVVGGVPTRPLIPWEVLKEALSAGFVLQNPIVWDKSIAIGDKTYGLFKPINSKRFLNQDYEFIFHLTKNGDVPIDRLAVGVPFIYKSNIKRFGHKNNLRCRGNVWHIPYKTKTSKEKSYNHPAPFPVALPKMCIKASGIPQGSLVVDPFVGTGTTLAACKRLHMNGIGFDTSPEYCKMAEERLMGSNPVTERGTQVPSGASPKPCCVQKKRGVGNSTYFAVVRLDHREPWGTFDLESQAEAFCESLNTSPVAVLNRIDLNRHKQSCDDQVTIPGPGRREELPEASGSCPADAESAPKEALHEQTATENFAHPGPGSQQSIMEEGSGIPSEIPPPDRSKQANEIAPAAKPRRVLKSLTVDGITVKPGYTCKHDGIDYRIAQVWGGKDGSVLLAPKDYDGIAGFGPVPVRDLRFVADPRNRAS